jgi:hypothetical protein
MRSAHHLDTQKHRLVGACPEDGSNHARGHRGAVFVPPSPEPYHPLIDEGRVPRALACYSDTQPMPFAASPTRRLSAKRSAVVAHQVSDEMKGGER